MTSLTFYGGAGEIGGNKILLEDKGVKIYLDFGQCFHFGEDFFYEYLEPRSANGMEVYFEFDLIPKVPKLYSEDMLRLADLKYEKPDVDGIVISHSHSDHNSHIQFIDPAIPVFMGHGTKQLLDIYQFLYPQFQKYGEHISLKTFKSGETFKIKHIEITPIHVEHSVPGAYGFIIKTSKGNIAYTGDLRLHGPKKEFTEEFIAKAAAAKPYLLLCEGTRMNYETEHNMAEEEVNKKIDQIVKNSKGTVFAYFSMSNVDRFNSVYKAAVDNKRIMVVDTRLAYIMSQMKDKVDFPDPLTDPNIRIYFRISKSCGFKDTDYYKWEREYCSKMITYKDIQKNPKEYVMFLGFFKLMELVYIQPKNADFIYSMSEHFLEGEDNEEMKTVLENWMKHFKINFHKAHCSGHASKQDIIKIVTEIKPKMVIPIHTENAEAFKEFHNNVKIVKNGEKIII
ncbi:MAG: MBL fold metallo-hydrolase [Candidatus Woesearchaeota archaeon]|nr:MBL fold metallo-hydrolase [Candidatus Woesearchaeota archaeon]